MLLSLFVWAYLVRRFMVNHPDEQPSRDTEINPLLAENEEYVTEEEYWEEVYQDEDNEFIDNDEFSDDEYFEEDYEKEYIEQPAYGYNQLYADDPEPSDWGSFYDRQTDCDDFHQEHNEDDRW